MRERTIPFAGLSFLAARSPANEWLRIQESSTVVRVFNDRILVELLVMGVLKARDAAAVYVGKLDEEAHAERTREGCDRQFQAARRNARCTQMMLSSRGLDGRCLDAGARRTGRRAEDLRMPGC